jgi:hypothetical protein
MVSYQCLVKVTSIHAQCCSKQPHECRCYLLTLPVTLQHLRLQLLHLLQYLQFLQLLLLL